MALWLATGGLALLSVLVYARTRLKNVDGSASDAAEIEAIVLQAVQSSLPDVADYLISTAQSSGRRRGILRRVAMLLPADSDTSALRAVIEIQLRIEDIERRLANEMVSPKELHVAVLVALAAITTLVGLIWLIVELLLKV